MARRGPVWPIGPTRCLKPLFEEAVKYYDVQALAALVVRTATINTWNRVNVISGQEAGEWTAHWANRASGPTEPQGQPSLRASRASGPAEP